MKILVLNGSPRPQGDTAKMVAVFRETAESAGHDVAVINVCRKNIKGCLACCLADLLSRYQRAAEMHSRSFLFRALPQSAGDA